MRVSGLFHNNLVNEKSRVSAFAQKSIRTIAEYQFYAKLHRNRAAETPVIAENHSVQPHRELVYRRYASRTDPIENQPAA